MNKSSKYTIKILVDDTAFRNSLNKVTEKWMILVRKRFRFGLFVWHLRDQCKANNELRKSFLKFVHKKDSR